MVVQKSKSASSGVTVDRMGGNMTEVEREIRRKVKVRAREGTDRQEFLRRIIMQADTLSDQEWDTFSDEAKQWLSKGTTDFNKGLMLWDFESEVVDAPHEPESSQVSEETGSSSLKKSEGEEEQDDAGTQDRDADDVDAGGVVVENCETETGVASETVEKIESVTLSDESLDPVDELMNDEAPRRRGRPRVPRGTDLTSMELTLYLLVEHPDMSQDEFVHRFLDARRTKKVTERGVIYRYQDFQIMKKLLKKLELKQTLAELDAC